MPDLFGIDESILGDWEDPYPQPEIHKHDGFYVVRDDLVEGGTKRRVLGKYIEHFSEFDEYIYASPRQGYGQLSLSIVCAEMNKKSTIFIPKGKHTWITEKSIEYGAKVCMHHLIPLL